MGDGFWEGHKGHDGHGIRRLTVLSRSHATLDSEKTTKQTVRGTKNSRTGQT